MAEISDIVAAIEIYLSQKGKGESYIANKVVEIFESDESPLNINGTYLNAFKERINKLNSSLNKISTTAEKFVNKLKTFNVNTLVKNMNSMSTQMSNFQKQMKMKTITHFFNTLQTFSSFLEKSSIDTSKNIKSNAVEQAITSVPVIDVNIESFSDNTKSFLYKLFAKFDKPQIVQIRNNAYSNQENGESGGFISSILKGVIGVTAIFAGIGFLSDFLTKTPMGKAIQKSLGNFANKALEVIVPFMKQMFEYVWKGIKTIFKDLPSMFLKATFNFFNLKELLGAENQGLAVIITKGIYYMVKKAFTSFVNMSTFGIFNKVSAFFTSKISKFGNMISKWGSRLLSPFTDMFSHVSGIVEKVGSFFAGIGKYFKSSSGIFGKLTAPFKIASKLLGGSVFKILGTVLKNVGKRIPLIGALISFKDAYDRFSAGDYTGGLLSIGSGIASTFPGIGTAISIGLDVLNALLDSASDGGKTSKLSIIGDFVSDLVDKLITGVKSFFGNLIDGIWNSVQDAGKWLADKSGLSWVSQKLGEGVDFISGNDMSITKAKNTPIIKINDGSSIGNKIIQPSSKDQVIAMQTGGPFDLALKDMNNKLNMLASVFAEGVQMIAATSAQGSSNIVQAVVSTANSSSGGGSTIINASSDPIGDFRLRAQRAIEFSSR